MSHPQTIGFTPRYEWHGRERAIVWRHCGADAMQARKPVTVVVYGRTATQMLDVTRCGLCGLSTDN